MAASKEGRSAAPPNAGKGRPKGTPNKVTGEVKAMVLAALEDAGGVAYLTKRANDPRTAAAFLSLVGKVLPLQVTGGDPGSPPITHHMTLEFVSAGAVSGKATPTV